MPQGMKVWKNRKTKKDTETGLGRKKQFYRENSCKAEKSKTLDKRSATIWEIKILEIVSNFWWWC